MRVQLMSHPLYRAVEFLTALLIFLGPWVVIAWAVTR